MYFWTFLDSGGDALGESHAFDDQAAAEDWMDRSWRDLAERGIDRVELRDRARGRRVYEMGLAADG